MITPIVWLIHISTGTIDVTRVNKRSILNGMIYVSFGVLGLYHIEHLSTKLVSTGVNEG